ncbi:YhfX family PLP-dependent enzyme [Tetragenococcus halophilus]|uniref:YhfX family PLP-dependent enzyme n=1 Tax=Tetragenococcus halophilus TaxID=51669 RepID=UPI002A94C2BD|nr:YhfX family PLP-dependent enzyme [Tetragenococcus halophilus]
MFLEMTTRRNTALIEAAKNLHQSGAILPDTYILDLDTILTNAKSLKKQADNSGIELFYMTKQIGRNPLVAKKLHEIGITNAVVVDFKEAEVMMEHNLPIGNIGHLVQIPYHMIEKVVNYNPNFITTYSMEMVKYIDDIAKKNNKKQKLLIKVIEPDDEIYAGQYGGFHLNELHALGELGQKLTNVEIAGLTSFPCFLLDNEDFELTHNVETIKQAKEILESYDLKINELNMPSATCVSTIPIIKKLGGTQGEPGHALTGTTPLHAKRELAEIPAMVYVSEVSHNLDGEAYFYGGGYYPRGHLENALVSHGKELVNDKVELFNNENIDYYLQMQHEHPVGSTVITAFRTQIFVTRSDVAVVSGIQNGQLKIEGVFDSSGNLKRR